MTKLQIKSEKLTPFDGIFSVMEYFDTLMQKTTTTHLNPTTLSLATQNCATFESQMVQFAYESDRVLIKA